MDRCDAVGELGIDIEGDWDRVVRSARRAGPWHLGQALQRRAVSYVRAGSWQQHGRPSSRQVVDVSFDPEHRRLALRIPKASRPARSPGARPAPLTGRGAVAGVQRKRRLPLAPEGTGGTKSGTARTFLCGVMIGNVVRPTPAIAGRVDPAALLVVGAGVTRPGTKPANEAARRRSAASRRLSSAKEVNRCSSCKEPMGCSRGA